MAHHKKIIIRGRSLKRKRHKKSKQVCFGDNGTHLEKIKHLYIIGNGFDRHAWYAYRIPSVSRVA